MIQAAHVHAARRKALGLVLESGLQLGRSDVPFGLVIELDHVAVRITADEGGPMAEIAVVPADLVA